ncbi:hypothetical protein JK202_15670 [Gluconobacter sp. Dm-62]|uniref:hypothetical protein n=1 Tax=Gluconobacter sp. Dm-62 TaxID=2799804 RepID=UPI001B8D3D66|nr:hypothetical protein [Gluconobacter sp. Dm-62]MBS1104413.1 hypothetical protein [Gluconobacter sp. Dm-62]
MKDSLLRPILPLLVVAALGALTPAVAHHVTTFLGLSGIFWASAMLMLEVTLLCIGLAAVRPAVSQSQRDTTVLHNRETILR